MFIFNSESFAVGGLCKVSCLSNWFYCCVALFTRLCFVSVCNKEGKVWEEECTSLKEKPAPSSTVL